MQISKGQFEKRLQKGELVISLIGMSNVGKTYWSKKLTELNFKHINCDDLIEKKLSPKLRALGYKGIKDVARWMGQPYEKLFLQNQKIYLQLEKGVLKQILVYLSKKKRENIVIDTTGSLIHTGRDICLDLKKRSLIVYIKATKNIEQQMLATYIKKPKPVVWQSVFRPQPEETNQAALQRCYPKLLKLRDALYTEYADIVIPLKATIPENGQASQFISLIKQRL